MVLVPLHLLAFLALYWGAMRIVRGEILKTHAHDAKIMLHHEVEEFHPLMVNGPTEDSYLHIEEFVRAHEIFQLSLYDADGQPILGSAQPNADVSRFLDADQPEQYTWIRREGRVEVSGIVRLTAEGRCVECHEAGEILGAATVSLDMTSQVGAARGRAGLHLGGLMTIWVLVVAVMNVVTRRFVRRSVARLEAGIDGEESVAAEPGSGIGKLLLDPVSERLYQSLEEVLHRQRERNEQVSSRLHHTERLASLGQLAAGLAHEIKNPLAGIHGVLELLRDDSSDESQSKLYDEMLAELDRVNGTIHSLLGFARPAPANRVPTNIEQLVDATVKLLRPGLTKKSIRLEISIAPDLREFPVDPDQIRQVLVNLISNAADAIDRNGTITVRATEFPNGNGVIIAVEDDGSGISEDGLARIFEPFHTTKFSGTGLGLAVARSLVDKHGGRIEVESELDKGTTFFVLLPATAEPVEE
jgi:signal transduction histidine kinase